LRKGRGGEEETRRGGEEETRRGGDRERGDKVTRFGSAIERAGRELETRN